MCRGKKRNRSQSGAEGGIASPPGWVVDYHLIGVRVPAGAVCEFNIASTGSGSSSSAGSVVNSTAPARRIT
jgi:hypothetical protein